MWLKLRWSTPPATGGKEGIHPHILVAAAEAGVKEIYRIGGAQAIGALAYGTESVPAVDKICGPGNIYVALAKRYVYGVVDIDSIAGPTDIAVLADDSADPEYVAADMLSQAEHDEMAAAVLITPSSTLAEAVKRELERQLAELPRRHIAARSLEQNGAIVIVKDLEEGIDVVNRLAPEHLELMVDSAAGSRQPHRKCRSDFPRSVQHGTGRRLLCRTEPYFANKRNRTFFFPAQCR